LPKRKSFEVTLLEEEEVRDIAETIKDITSDEMIKYLSKKSNEEIVVLALRQLNLVKELPVIMPRRIKNLR